jgi:glucosyl-dolichyl phosphate glucuronosyltransferase
VSGIKITAAICTHNRAMDLAACLDALAPQRDPAIEFIVVDSGSAPAEAAAIVNVVNQKPGFRLIRLDTPGLSLARNTALAQAQGEWLALIDDDAVPAADWVRAALDLYDRLPANVAVLGGRVTPLMPPHAARPLGPRWMQLISAVEVDGESDCTDNPRVVGANMWFRSAPLRVIGGFPENLGRVGNSLLSGEDKLVLNQLTAKGLRVWYSDKLKVGHRIHADRLSRRWASKRAYWDGVSDRRIAGMLGARPSPGEAIGVILKLIPLMLLYPVSSPEHEFFLRFWYDLGWLHETVTPVRAH